MKVKPAFKLYLFIGSIALLLTLALHPLLPEWFEKYTLDMREDTRSFPNPNLLYHDFDHDGFSELAVLKYQRDIDESALKIYAYNGGLLNQWTLEERWLPHSMIFGDYNKDGNDEVYVFTKTRDSLFLYAIDPQSTKKFIIYRAFIARAPQKVKRWDLRPIAGLFTDSDGDGFDDLLFNVMAGYAKQPRQLFAFSVHKNKRLGVSPASSAFLALPQKITVNSSQYILMNGSVSLENTEKDSPYSDYAAWLTVFNPQLQFVFSPIPFEGKNTELTAFPFGLKKDRIIVLVKYGGKDKSFVRLLLYDYQGRLLARQELHGREWQLFTGQSGGRQNMFLLQKNKKTIYTVTEELKLQPKRRLRVAIDNLQMVQMDLDGDFQPEWIARHSNRLCIVQNDFSHILSIPLINLNIYQPLLSVKKNGNRPQELSVQVDDKKYLLKYKWNPWYPFFWLSRVLVFLLLFGLVGIVTLLYNRISAYRFSLQTMLQNPERGMLLLTRQGNVRYMNHTLVDQLNLGLTEYKGENIRRVLAPFHDIAKLIDALLTARAPVNEDIVMQEKAVSLNGRFYGTPIKVLFNYTYGFYIELNDYSKPVQNDRLKVWSKTVQKMAHDIKAPLSSIALNMTTLNLKLADSAPDTYKMIEPELKLMLNEVNRVKSKTINFLKFTNLEAPRFNRFPVSDLIQRTLELFKSYADQSVRFHVEIEADVEYLYGDEQQLQMALQAIIENSIDAVRADGAIAVTVFKTNQLQNPFTEFVEIDVSDTGPGIPKEHKDKIFEPYFTTKKEGTGMGMAIAKKIILEHQGEISVYSTEKFATVIKIMLPVGNNVAKKKHNPPA